MLTTIPCLAQGCARQPGEAVNQEGYPNLIGRWSPINQGPGGYTLYDSSGHPQSPGDLHNIPAANWHSSRYGAVVNFPAATSHIRIPLTARLVPQHCSIRVVFRSPAVLVATGWVISAGETTPPADVGYQIYYTNLGVLSTRFENVGWHVHATAAGVIAADTWYDVMVTYSGIRCCIWVNGAKLVDEAEAVAFLPPTNLFLVIGNFWAATVSFEGKIALVEVYDQALHRHNLDPHYLARTE